MRDLGMGRLVTFAGWRNPAPGIPTFYDNGAFTAYRQGKPFDVTAFVAGFAKVLLLDAEHETVGVLAPDIVGSADSLAFSLAWVERMEKMAAALGARCPPIYLAVQNGMTPQDVEPHVKRFAGLFVGGTIEWKHDTAAAWVALGHAHGLPVHIGRVGTVADLVWARSIGADSVDSTSWAQNGTYEYVSQARGVAVARAQRTIPEVMPRAGDE